MDHILSPDQTTTILAALRVFQSTPQLTQESWITAMRDGAGLLSASEFEALCELLNTGTTVVRSDEPAVRPPVEERWADRYGRAFDVGSIVAYVDVRGEAFTSPRGVVIGVDGEDLLIGTPGAPNPGKVSSKDSDYLVVLPDAGPVRSPAGSTHSHDCSRCVFLGYWRSGTALFDLYKCVERLDGHTSLVARYGSDGPQYCSMTMRNELWDESLDAIHGPRKSMNHCYIPSLCEAWRRVKRTRLVVSEGTTNGTP